jgi:hypothetical protein
MKQELLESLLQLLLESRGKTSSAELPFEVGEKYYIRTVTHHQTGKVKAIVGKFLILEQAAWIADSGRFMNAILDGKLDEVEPVKEAIVNTDTIIDAFVWQHDLPTKQQ